MKRSNLLILCRVALLAAATALLAQAAIPLPSGVSLTLQTFAVALCGYLLGAGQGTAAVAIYLALGAVGLPVFAGLRGGIAVLLGPSGGFLWGFPIMAALCGLCTAKRTPLALVSGFCGLLVCHASGAAQYAWLGHISFFASAAAVSLPFLLKDIVSLVLACFCARLLRRRIGLK